MPLRRLLVVAYAFPPETAMGALRPWGLYRHLQAHGIEPVVITASPGGDLANVIRVSHPRVLDPLRSLVERRPDLWKRVAKSTRRARRLLAELTAHPDEAAAWRHPAFIAGLEQLRGGAFGAILSTSLPATAHLVARDLKKASGLPWVADMRDLWADNYDYPWGKLRRAFDRRTEDKVLADADVLVSVSEPLTAILRSRHPAKAAWCIHNGFPPEEMADSDHPLLASFALTYTGTLYPEKQDPSPVLEALAELVHDGQIDRAFLDLRFYGRNVDQPSLRALLSRFGLLPNVTFGGLLRRTDTLSRQRESQILLALDWMDQEQPGVYGGKVYEYLAAQRPILCAGRPGSVVDSLLRETRAGSCYDDATNHRAFLIQSYREFRRTGRVAYGGDATAIRRFDHREMARRFSELLDGIWRPVRD